MAILDYEQVWNSLESLGERVKAERELKAKVSDEDVAKENIKKEKTEENKDEGDKAEEIVKTDKILIGNKTSWAVAKIVGEVSSLSFDRACSQRSRRMWRRADRWSRMQRRRRTL